jgi:RNA polymerase sigma-70 factor, ECF subfamily
VEERCEACNHLTWLARVSDVNQLPIGTDAAVTSGGTTEVRGAYVGSFDDVYQREYPGLVRLAFVLTGRLDIAEELVQDAFEAAHRKWHRLSEYDRPGAWVRRVVLQRCIGRYRRLAVETRALVRMSSERERSNEIVIADQDLLAAIRSLPPRQAQVVALVLLEDRSIDDVADLLGCNAATTRTHLRRGRLALATMLGVTEHTTPEELL